MKIVMLIIGIIAFVFSMVFTGYQTNNISGALKFIALLIYSFFAIYLSSLM